jgi:small-conductance mechanosensitive channel
LLDVREADLKILREQLATSSEAIDQTQNEEEIEQLRIDLIEARSEVEELEEKRIEHGRNCELDQTTEKLACTTSKECKC